MNENPCFSKILPKNMFFINDVVKVVNAMMYCVKVSCKNPGKSFSDACSDKIKQDLGKNLTEELSTRQHSPGSSICITGLTCCRGPPLPPPAAGVLYTRIMSCRKTASTGLNRKHFLH